MKEYFELTNYASKLMLVIFGLIEMAKTLVDVRKIIGTRISG